jgi:hypothetical protein
MDEKQQIMKQTAVEWLYDRFIFAGYAVPPIWREQAKAIEKVQMIEFAKYISVIDTEKSDMKKVIDFYLTHDGEEFVEDKSE